MKKATLRCLCAGLFLFILSVGIPMNYSLASDRIATSVDQKVSAATVMVFMEYDAPYENRSSWGTGFVIGDGLIMTNAHVVTDNMPKRIYVQNGMMPATEARVVSSRYDTADSEMVIGIPGASYYDVAILSFTPPAGVRLPSLPFSLNTMPSLDVFAYGYPNSNQGMRLSRYTGRSVPSARQTVNGGQVNEVIQSSPSLLMHDALCIEGNSGGPLVNERGEVVGMQTWSTSPDYDSIVTSFAIGSHGLLAFAQSVGARPAIAS